MLVGMVLPTSLVWAAGSITTSISTGPVGSSVTVSGSGFTPSVNCYVFFDTFAFGPYPAAGGSLLATIQVPKVARTGSSYQIYVGTDEVPPSVSNSVYFTITSQISIGAAVASVGDSVTVFGNGFYANSVISIYFDNAVAGTTNTDSTGSFDAASFLVPPAYRGTHQVKCKDASEFSPGVNLTIMSKITVSPSSGGAADKVAVNGSGFVANSAISFYWNDAPIAALSATTDINGSFTAPSFNIPTGFKGSHTIKAQDVNANTATTSFSIAQKISISPASAVSGTVATVSGNGFDAGKNITIKYNFVPVVTNPATITTDSSGGFTATFAVPAGDTGNYTIEVYDGNNLAQATFSAIAEVKISQETTAAKPGYVGEEITLTGNGLRPNATVNIYFASDTVQIETATTDGNGHFSATIKIPPSTPGDHTITITDGLTIKSFPFYMENQTPATPKLLLPTPNGKQQAQGQFTWEAVIDPSGVTYTFQIAIDKDFTSIIIEKKGLGKPDYTLSAQEKLPSNKSGAPYYWRVKTTDGTGLDSGWSTAPKFNVGFVLELTGWVLYTILGLGGILLFLMGFLLGKRTAQR